MMDDQENAPQLDVPQELLRMEQEAARKREFDRCVELERYNEIREFNQRTEIRESLRLGMGAVEVVALIAIAVAAVKIAWG